MLNYNSAQKFEFSKSKMADSRIFKNLKTAIKKF